MKKYFVFYFNDGHENYDVNGEYLEQDILNSFYVRKTAEEVEDLIDYILGSGYGLNDIRIIYGKDVSVGGQTKLKKIQK